MKRFLVIPGIALTAIFILLSFTIGKTDNTSQPSFLAWASKPPMGWNSWDCYGPTVTEREVKTNADYMASYLKKYGWEYIVVDIRWYIENDKAHGYNEKDAVFSMDEYGRLIPAVNRFPSSANGKGFKPLADYIHSKGLKFGIHIMRGIPKITVERNVPIMGSAAKAKDIYSTVLLCKWLGDMYTVDASKPGAQEYYNSLFALYASWGLDFIKIDDLSRPYHQREIELIRKAIDGCGRPIVLSTSPGETPIENAEHVKTHANMWRIIDDFWDNWRELEMHFDLFEKWQPHMGPGHWPDGDMLPLGRIGIRAERGDNRMSKFTRDEQYTLMTLFSICRSPLMFGGDLPSNDAFTRSLITNKEVLDVNQNSTNNRQLFKSGDKLAWVADVPDSRDKYLALFNRADQQAIVEENAVWKSDILSYKAKNQTVDIDIEIAGTRKIYLVTTDAGDGTSWDHADWIDPVISGKTGRLKLTELEWKKATAGWGEVAKNKSVSRGILGISGTSSSVGFGTHANSVIEFDLPEGYTHFTAKAGLDKVCNEHKDASSVRFLVFDKDPAGPAPADSVKINITLSELGIKGACKVRDLWTHKELGRFSGEFAPYIRKHGSGLYRLSPVN